MTVLHELAVFKTANFCLKTDFFFGLDLVLQKIIGSIILQNNRFFLLNKTNTVYQISAIGTKLFFVHLVDSGQIVFFDFESADIFLRKGDLRFFGLLKKATFEVSVTAFNRFLDLSECVKLYRLANSTHYFPVLSKPQREIVAIEDKNVIVHGVAGSGKTNLCIDKIIFCAGRGYRGRVLYSTFSRALLADTKAKVTDFCTNVKNLIGQIEGGDAVFACTDRIKAVENALGVYLVPDPDNIALGLKKIVDFLTTQVDYLLIEDIFKSKDPKLTNQKPCDEKHFKEYLKNLKNHNLKNRLNQIDNIPIEAIYKEIFGLVFGYADKDAPQKMLSEAEYVSMRKDSFALSHAQSIYALAQDYLLFINQNGLLCLNQASRKMLLSSPIPIYSLAILDEVQDYTQINLIFLKSLCIKMFCVGDALQMINPSYFSFSFLKRLLFQKDLSSSVELENNYRCSKKIASICQCLAEKNSFFFGTHSFVLKQKGVFDKAETETVFVGAKKTTENKSQNQNQNKEKNQTADTNLSAKNKNDDLKSAKDFLPALNKEAFNNYTIIVPTTQIKDFLRQTLTKQEILTVSQAKGLERDTVILFDILSSLSNAWGAFARKNINKKTSDENSVYRYYFNLLYVALSRAKTKLYVLESNPPPIFDDFFEKNFDNTSAKDALDRLLWGADKMEAEQDEVFMRVKEFITLAQYDNARFWAGKIASEGERAAEFDKIDIYEKFVSVGDYRGAGIGFLQKGLFFDAKAQFAFSSDLALENLCDSLIVRSGGEIGDEGFGSKAAAFRGAGEGGGGSALANYDNLASGIVDVFFELEQNTTARNVILDLIKSDVKKLKENSDLISGGLKKIAKK